MPKLTSCHILKEKPEDCEYGEEGKESRVLLCIDNRHIYKSLLPLHLFCVIKNSIYGAVCRALPISRNTGLSHQPPREVAVKVYLKSLVHQLRNAGCKENPWEEIRSMQLIGNQCPNVLGAHCCCEDESNYYLVTPFLEGDEFFEHIVKVGALSEQCVQVVMKQLLTGLHYLHSSLLIAHRDISLENIFFDPSTLQATIIDFGLSIRLSSNEERFRIPNPLAGKGPYMSPEMTAKQSLVDPFASDIWSLGISMLYLLLGFPPIEQASVEDHRYTFIVNGDLKDLLCHWGVNLSPLAVDMVETMLQFEPADRPDALSLLSHPFLKDVQP